MLRFADDFVVFCRTKADAMSLYDKLDPLLKKRGLELNHTKSKVTPITDGFDFVGFHTALVPKFGYENAIYTLFALTESIFSLSVISCYPLLHLAKRSEKSSEAVGES